jgi:hypothetical protein
MNILQTIGSYFVNKYQIRQMESGTQIAAKQMRKQGIPLHIALAILANRY